jgi:tetratricopeptide (TPR) repeat protein
MEYVLGVMLVWLLAAAWIFLLVNWAITGEVSAAEAALGSTVALLLALASAQRAFPYVVPFSLATLGGGAVALPLLRAYLNRAAHAQMDAQLIERACLAYEFDPKNYGALINLAEACYKNGLLEQAVHHLECAIQQAPDHGSQREATAADVAGRAAASSEAGLHAVPQLRGARGGWRGTLQPLRASAAAAAGAGAVGAASTGARRD